MIILGGGFIARRISGDLDIPIVNRRINFYSDVEGIIDDFNPKVIINCIGFTGNDNVDDCDKEWDKYRNDILSRRLP